MCVIRSKTVSWCPAPAHSMSVAAIMLHTLKTLWIAPTYNFGQAIAWQCFNSLYYHYYSFSIFGVCFVCTRVFCCVVRRKLALSIWERCCLHPKKNNENRIGVKPIVCSHKSSNSLHLHNWKRTNAMKKLVAKWIARLLIINQMQSKLLLAYWIARPRNEISTITTATTIIRHFSTASNIVELFASRL